MDPDSDPDPDPDPDSYRDPQQNFKDPEHFFFYVPETHILYFIRRSWFLKCSEEGLLGGGGMYYITYQYFIMYQ